MKKIFWILVCAVAMAACNSPWGNQEVPNAADAGIDTRGWQETVVGDYSFKMPQGWTAEFKHFSAPMAFDLISVKNTGLSVVTGGAAPDDFYAGGGAIDSGKYADNYTLIQVAVYSVAEVGESWETFFEKVYPGVVETYRDYSANTEIELSMVYADSVTGVYTGSPRLFARSGNRIYDLSLHDQAAANDAGTDIFYAFISEFRF